LAIAPLPLVLTYSENTARPLPHLLSNAGQLTASKSDEALSCSLYSYCTKYSYVMY